jgi:hypothetical protein
VSEGGADLGGGREAVDVKVWFGGLEIWLGTLCSPETSSSDASSESTTAAQPPRRTVTDPLSTRPAITSRRTFAISSDALVPTTITSISRPKSTAAHTSLPACVETNPPRLSHVGFAPIALRKRLKMSVGMDRFADRGR